MVLINVHITFFWLSIHSAHVSNGVDVYNRSSLHLIDTAGDVQQLTLRLSLTVSRSDISELVVSQESLPGSSQLDSRGIIVTIPTTTHHRKEELEMILTKFIS